MTLQQAIAKIWAETMSKQEFSTRTSGLAYSKEVSEHFSVITFQKMQGASSFCVNLALHPRWASAWGADYKPLDHSTIKETECIFHQRLAPPGQGDQWFDYARDDDSLLAAATDSLSLYEKVGAPLVRDLIPRLESLGTLSFDQFQNREYDLLGFERARLWTAKSIAEKHRLNGRAELAHPFEVWVKPTA